MKKIFAILLLLTGCCYAQLTRAQFVTKTIFNNAISTMNSSVASSLATAKAYADTKDAATLAAAKKYTDDIRVAITGDYMKQFAAIPRFDSVFTKLPGVRLVKLADGKFDIQVQVYWDASCKCYKLNWQ